MCVVVLVNGGQSCTREGTMKWFCGVESDVEFSSAVFDLLVDHGWNVEAVVLAVDKWSVCRLCSCV